MRQINSYLDRINLVVHRAKHKGVWGSGGTSSWLGYLGDDQLLASLWSHFGSGIEQDCRGQEKKYSYTAGNTGERK